MEYPASLAIPTRSAFTADLTPPGSKSLTNRALLLAAAAQGASTLDGVLFCDDSKVMLEALKKLGIKLIVDEPSRRVTLEGQKHWAGPGAGVVELFTGNSGTTTRFLAALCAAMPDLSVRIDGIPRMRQRPIGDLTDALTHLGAAITFDETPGFPPVRITGARLLGGRITMKADASSQFVSAMLMAGARSAQGLTIGFDGPVVSKPYIQMTLAVMHRFGVTGQIQSDWSRVDVPPGQYKPCAYAIEPDASNASYFLAAAAVVPGSKVTIHGLGRRSVQGDVGFADVLHQMGAGLVFGGDFITVMSPPDGQPLRGVEVDLNAMPDMAQTLAVVAMFARGPTTIRGVGNLRVKETDRIAALQNEISRFGARVEVDGDDITIIPPTVGGLTAPARGVDTYDDHRMAMSFSVAGLVVPGVVIHEPSCVAKTFPDYFEYLDGLGR